MTPKHDSSVSYFLHVLPAMKLAAKHVGYALTTHGSMTKDIDLVAIPWVETTQGPHELLDALCEACGGFRPVNGKVEKKPHGRVAYAIFIPGSSLVIDLSVITRD